MILVTGVSGSLGGLILDGLSAVEDIEVAGGTRSGDGVTRRHIDFDDPASLLQGFNDVDVLVFVSAGYAEDDVVLARHGAVADAAAAAGVRHVIYTSLVRSGELMTTALPHRWTEARLTAGPFDLTVLRNGLYAELLAGFAMAGAESAAATGVFPAALGAGRVSVVAREDLADVAVRVAVDVQRDLKASDRSRHAGKTYELEGVTALGGEDLAKLLTGSLGRAVEYRAVSLFETRKALTDSGMEPYQIANAMSLLSNAGAGVLEAHDGDLTSLLPTAPRSISDLLTQTFGVR